MATFEVEAFYIAVVTMNNTICMNYFSKAQRGQYFASNFDKWSIFKSAALDKDQAACS